jgi:hypothetical protein
MAFFCCEVFSNLSLMFGLNNEPQTQVGTAGLIMSLYEVGLYVQTMVVKELTPANPALCLAFKILAVASILLTRKYLLTGSSALFGASIVAIAVYIALWAACFWVLEIRFTLIQVSPVAVVYFLLGHLAAKVIGGNTKAEVARAQQLEKLERVQQK